MPLEITASGAEYGDDALPVPDLSLLAEQHFVSEAGIVQLRGSYNPESQIKTFPPRPSSPDTSARTTEPFLFGPSGSLYSFTQVHVSSSRPTPYVIGYVDFPEGVRVLAHVETSDPESLKCDMPVELRSDDQRWFVVPASTRNDGDNQ
ncbi:MAG: OB-fold domain-containing protein [Rhodobiaceae bacterium]|nr:OB-fold domain-containing protein [Rhodobiaceae bacterium]